MRTRTGPITESLPATSSARLIQIMPPPTLRLFDAPEVLTTGREVFGLNVLVWLYLAIWIFQSPAAAEPGRRQRHGEADSPSRVQAAEWPGPRSAPISQ